MMIENDWYMIHVEWKKNFSLKGLFHFVIFGVLVVLVVPWYPVPNYLYLTDRVIRSTTRVLYNKFVFFKSA